MSSSKPANTQPSDPASPTGQLCTWISSLSLQDIPGAIQERAKYLILDGIACALVGAHLPASETAAKAIFAMEPPGSCTVFGWPNNKIGPLPAALLNSTFIQGFELDDWHSDAPLHSNSILIPSLIAAIENLVKNGSQTVTGQDFLLAMLTGYEVGPRVGQALYGWHILSAGWHSGAVFGPSASAAAVSKLIGLSPAAIEDALGIACTQACGLMSAQFESDVKRMQHGFAARNGLLGALLAQGGYIGIKRVYEREYAGFLKQFSSGNGKDPAYLVEEIYKGLGETWRTEGVRPKAYAAMAGTHCTIDCVRALQEKFPEAMSRDQLQHVKSIEIHLAQAALDHGGWKAERPLNAIGAQMSNAYAAATQMIDEAVTPAQFRHDKLDRDEVWNLINKTSCSLGKDFASSEQEVIITLEDGKVLDHRQPSFRGVDPALTNEQILEKWRSLTKQVMDEERQKKIEDIVLSLEKAGDLTDFIALLKDETSNPIA